MPDRTPLVRDPKAVLWHPDYRDFGSQDKTKAEVFPKFCVREGHEHEADLRKGHVISKSTLQLITDPQNRVTALQTGYQDEGAAYIPIARHPPLKQDKATTAPAFCGICEENFKSADGLPDVSRNVDLRRALHEACTRNTHHVIWRLLLFNKKLDGLEGEAKLPDLLGLRPANEHIIELAQACLPPLPDDPIPAGTPLERDGHFRHFTWHYPNTEFKVAVSTEVVLQHENDPTTRTLAFINVVPQKTAPDAGWHTAAALSVPLPPAAPSIWQDILDNSEHSGNFNEPEHQLMISNLATRSPDYAVSHGQLRGWRGQRQRSADLPLFPPGSKVARPVVNITGNDLSDLTRNSFSIFA